MLTRIIADKSADLINLKISKVIIIFSYLFRSLIFLLCLKYIAHKFCIFLQINQLVIYIFPPYFFFLHQVGGLTKARAVRDLAVSAGIAMNIEDTWGGDIVTAGKAYFW